VHGVGEDGVCGSFKPGASIPYSFRRGCGYGADSRLRLDTALRRQVNALLNNRASVRRAWLVSRLSPPASLCGHGMLHHNRRLRVFYASTTPDASILSYLSIPFEHANANNRQWVFEVRSLAFTFWVFIFETSFKTTIINFKRCFFYWNCRFEARF